MTVANWVLTVALICGTSAVALADDLVPTSQEGVVEAVASDDPFGALAPIETVVLGEKRGGIDSVDIAIDDVAINAAELKAVNANNSVSGSVNGDINQNNISDMNGVSAVMFNTGNNVNMMSSIQVNVFMD